VSLSENSTSLTVAENSLATAILIPTPSDTSYTSAQLTVTVTALPSNGIVLLADGITPVHVGEILTVAQLIGLRFRPTLNSFSQSSSFGFTVSDPAGYTASSTATLTIGSSNTPVVTTWTSLTEPANGPTTAIGIPAPTDASYTSSQLTVKVTALPTDGTVVLSDGVTAVTAGETLTVAQLTGLEFKPAASSAGQDSTFSYSVTEPAGHSATGKVLLQVAADTPPVTTSTSLTVAENSGATPIGIPAPTDASFATSALSAKVAGLPTDGTVVLSDGITVVTAGESLTVAQLTGLEFKPASGAFAQSSSFAYSVSDPTGATTSSSATLSIGANNTPLVTTPASLTVVENSGVTPIGIVAPSDANYAASQLSVKVTALPTDGTVLLSNGTTPVTVGESLTVAQLTGLEFTPNQDSTGQSSTFTYTVSDPAGKTATGSVTLTTGPNAIVLENEKPGTPESVWQVDPGQDSTTIQGFTTSISTNAGGTVDFKIDNQTSNANYQIDIYRLGYYGGDGATLVTTLNHQAASAIVQPAALVDPTTGLVDAGNWQVTDSWAIPANATSGVYVANVVDGSQVFQIPFIVTNDSSNSDIVFQTSDETWQAYNGWGGANLYGGDGPANPPASAGGEFGTGAAFAVSYNRPIVTQDGVGLYAGPQDSLFGAEYDAIYWLEENGYDVSYISGIDTATNGSLLLNHKVFMDAGHDEYWTDSQVANVQAAVNAGVNLAFLSGNEIFWQTRLEPSIDGSGTADRTLVSYKDTHYGTEIDPTGTATGTFEDPRLGSPPEPSNELTGTLFQVDGPNSNGSTITIPYGDTQLRFWRNTSVADTPPGQTASLEPGLLGYEWDSSPDNGFMPAGLVDLSSTALSEPGVSNTDFGNIDTSGTATHNLVEYRDPTSGALVFGAGTVFWSWGLAAQADSPSPDDGFSNDTTDPNVQQATVNLLADMGVQPATLQASLVIATQSTAHTPPTSTISNVSSTNTVEGQAVTVSGTATAVGGVIGGVEISTDGGKTWNPANSPEGSVTVNWTYTFTAPAPGTYTIESRAVDDSLNLETPGPGVSYTSMPSSALSLFSSSSTPATADVNDANAVEVGVKFTSATPGYITGIRFYKGSLNTGTHTGDLWSSSGTLLATATFTNETASGWQQVNFSSPVKITAGTTYIASYHTNSGEYADTPYYFATYQGQTDGSLNAAGDNLNGVYAYGASSIFPSTTSTTGDNFWVDVVFDDTVNQPQANNVSVVTTENTTLSIPASTLLANDTDPNGYALSVTDVSSPSNGTVSYNSSTQTVTFVPTTGYTGPAGFTYSITDGHGGAASATVSVTVDYPATAQSLFFPGTTPGTVTANDPSAVELGVKFQASTNGTIIGIRFYKGSQNTGTHVGDLWSASGTLLATASFTNETASGWQQVNFSNPVAITAGTTYIASYHTNTGEYSADSNYFATAYTNQALTALASGSSGGDGVYVDSSSPAFPSNSYQASNYWVDVVFDANGSVVTANPVTGLTTAETTALSIPASTLLANDTDSAGYSLSVSGVSNPINGTVSYNSSTQTVSFVPTSGYSGPAGFTYSVTDGHGDAASANVSLTVDYPATAQSLFFPSATPGTVTVSDTSPVELGVKFQASANGTITGIRFYKGSQNTGTHVGDLWSASGTLLATATFTNETASGWQQVNFSNPVAVTAGTTYVASYHTNTGEYSADGNYFATAYTNEALTALASGTSGGDGVYTYSSNPAFPTNSYNASNYWADVVFDANGSAVTANPVTGLTMAENTALSIPASTLLANDTDSAGYPLSISGVSNPSNGTVSYNSSNQTVSFVPTTGYVGPAGFTYSVTDGNGGTGSASVSLAVDYPTTAQSLFFPSTTPGTVTVNDPSAVELGVKFQASTNGNITGIRFYKGSQNTGTHVGDLWSASGTLLATATFTNETASGWQQVNFSNPVAITAGTTYIASYHTNTGEYSDDGNYFATAYSNGNLTALASGSSGGDGVYTYSSSPAFPNNSYNASNYWVDVVFDANAPVVTANPVSGLSTTENTALSIPASTLLANDTDSAGYSLSISGVSNPTNGTVSYNSSNQTVSLVPNSGYVGPASFTYSVTDGNGGAASANASLAVDYPVTAQSLFLPGDTPGTVTVNDPSAAELGVKFQASTNGSITGISFYKGSQNTGTHVGDLWSASGSLLATATFTNETASGWQEVNFSSPVAITAGTTYVASYHTNTGEYSGDGNYFAAAHTNINGTLTAPSSSSSGGNGVYAYGGSSLFPNNSFNATNYWVDVVFNGQLVG
jgi:hypothetical protein